MHDSSADGLYYISCGGQLLGADSGDGYILPIFPRAADAEEFMAASGIEGEAQDIMCPDMLADLCRLCVPEPGVRWIVLGPAPAPDMSMDDKRLVATERFLSAFRKVYETTGG